MATLCLDPYCIMDRDHTGPCRLRAAATLAESVPVHDPVSHPSHYTKGRFEVWDVLDEWFPNNPLRWQVGKYIARADHKGNTLQDLKKARAYLDREINKLEGGKA